MRVLATRYAQGQQRVDPAGEAGEHPEHTATLKSVMRAWIDISAVVVRREGRIALPGAGGQLSVVVYDGGRHGGA